MSILRIKEHEESFHETAERRKDQHSEKDFLQCLTESKHRNLSYLKNSRKDCGV